MAGTHSHKRETARRMPRAAAIAGPLSVLATGAAVAAGVLGATPASNVLTAGSSSAVAGDIAGDIAGTTVDRGSTVSRGGEQVERAEELTLTPLQTALQPATVNAAIAGAKTKLWTTEDMNLWSTPAEDAKQRGTFEGGKKVLITGRKMMGREEVVVDGKAYWMNVGYLTAEKPAIATIPGAECTNGSSISGSESPHIIDIHRVVCANWPEITTYGTWRPGDGGDHGSGRAIDIMTSGATGWEVAEFLMANYQTFNINYIIYQQHIWQPAAGGGWQGMADRGSITANHYDHVHVSVY